MRCTEHLGELPIFNAAQRQAAGRISAPRFTDQGTLVALQKRAHKNKPTKNIAPLQNLVDHFAVAPTPHSITIFELF
jgi:hypothetical protein